MTSQGMGSRQGKDLGKDSTCSSFLQQGEREVRGGRERRKGESRESRYRETAGGDWAGLTAAE